MKLKQLEALLGNLDQFSNPKVELEQYPTGPHIASRMLYTAENSFDDVSGRVVADFGCGCGTLGVASALLDADYVMGIDVDPESLEIASLNAEDLELDIHFIQCNINNLELRGPIVDTVVMNPPFGTRKKGADMNFLAVGLKVASQAVYSLHKTTTREHVRKAALRDFNAKSAEVLCELRYDVPQLYKFHKKKEVDIAVDLWRFVPHKDQERVLLARHDGYASKVHTDCEPGLVSGIKAQLLPKDSGFSSRERSGAVLLTNYMYLDSGIQKRRELQRFPRDYVCKSCGVMHELLPCDA